VNCLKIVKYRKSTNGKYKIALDNGMELNLYEEVILAYKLLLRHDIDNDILVDLDRLNQEYDVYYIALRSLTSRIKSTFDLRIFLQKREYPVELIDKAILKLTEQGYLNDRSYTKSYINNQMITTNNGPYKISRMLLEKNIDKNIIAEEIEVFTPDEQKIRINKIIQKSIKSNNSRGGIVLKQKVFNDLKMLGYDIELINELLSNYEFENDLSIAKKEYDKLYRKYSKKYSGEELTRIIKSKLYQKGLKYDEE